MIGAYFLFDQKIVGYSFYEIYVTSQRAFSAMGFPHGSDEDAAFIISWLELNNFGGISLLASSIKELDQKYQGILDIEDLSKTINFKAISEINLLAKKIAKKNKFNFYKKILITLNKEDLKQELSNLNLDYKYIILPIFLFRGMLLENLISVVKEKNKKNQKKFILCNHLNNYKNIQNLMQNLITSKIT